MVVKNYQSKKYLNNIRPYVKDMNNLKNLTLGKFI